MASLGWPIYPWLRQSSPKRRSSSALRLLATLFILTSGCQKPSSTATASAGEGALGPNNAETSEDDEAKAAQAFGQQPASAKRQIAPGDEALAAIEAQIEAGQLEQAWRAAQDLVAQQPKQANAHYAHGLVLSRRGDDAAAQASFERALAVDPQHPYAKIARARYLGFGAHDLQRARQMAREVVASRPDFAEAQLVLGTLELELGEPELARAALEKARAKESNHPDVHYHLARAYAATGRLQEAISSSERAIAIEPGATGVDMRMLRGRLIGQTGDRQATVAAFEEAMRVVPNRLDIRLEAVRSLLRLGWLDQAQALFEPALKSHPNDIAVVVTQGRLLAARAKLDGKGGALARFDSAIRLDPKAMAPHFYKIEALVGAKRCVEAKKALAQAGQLKDGAAELARAQALVKDCNN